MQEQSSLPEVSIIWSDLHFGWRWPAWMQRPLDWFGIPPWRSRAGEILQIHSELSKLYNVKRVVKNGDVLHSSKILTQDLNPDELAVLSLWQKFYMQGIEVFATIGNHDPLYEHNQDILKVPVKRDYSWTQPGGLAFFLTHSDKFDKVLGKEKLSCLVADFFMSLAMLTKIQWFARLGGFWRRQAESVKEEVLDFAKNSWSGKKIIFANSGCALRGLPLTFLIINGSQVSLGEFKNRKLKVRKTLLLEPGTLLVATGHTHYAELSLVA